MGSSFLMVTMHVAPAKSCTVRSVHNTAIFFPSTMEKMHMDSLPFKIIQVGMKPGPILLIYSLTSHTSTKNNLKNIY